MVKVKKERYYRDKGWQRQESSNEGDVRVLAALAVGGWVREGPALPYDQGGGEWKWRSVKVIEARAVDYREWRKKSLNTRDSGMLSGVGWE